MNRQQRRKLKKDKEKQETVYNLSQENISAIKQEARKEAFEQFKNVQRELFEEYAKDKIKDSFELSLAIFMLFLRDELNYGGDELKKSIKGLIGYYNDWNKNRFSVKDAVEAIKDETGYSLDFETNMGTREIKLNEAVS